MRIGVVLLIIPLISNVIDYSENSFADIYVPYIDYEDVIEVPYKFLTKKETSAIITIKVLTYDSESIIYREERSSGNKTYISDVFPLSGQWFDGSFTLNFEANINNEIYSKHLYLPFINKTVYEFEDYLKINNPSLSGLNSKGSIRQMNESIELAYASSSQFKFDLSDFAITYHNDLTDLFYLNANLKITDKDDVFAYIGKIEDSFTIPLELSKSGDEVFMSFKENVYLEQSTFSTFLDYREGLISLGQKLYFPFDRKIENTSVEISLVIESFGYGNSDIVFSKDYYFTYNTLGLCATSEVCVKHV